MTRSRFLSTKDGIGLLFFGRLTMLVTLFFFAILLIAGFANALEPVQQEQTPPQLGIPIQQPDDELQLSRTYAMDSIPPDRTGGWSVDPSDRQISRAFYNSVYLAPISIDSGWSGDVGSCNQGTTTSNFKNGVLVRVNYFRAMAGIPADIAFDATNSSKSQQAALMMSRNNTLSHTPPSSWTCYTAEGDEAAGSSNLSLGNYGWDAVSGQVRDNGSNNTIVGHRRWILYPQTQTMGTGDIPPSPGYSSANSLWVFDGNYGTSRPATRETYVAWPPPGYVPYDVVPARWSFSYDGADFSGASVAMTSGGTSVSVVLHTVATGYGENTLVWVADGLDANQWYTRWPAPSSDTTYTVNITNVDIAGTPTNFSYDVTVIDPAEQGVGETYSTITGTRYPPIGSAETYSFSAVSFADSYEVLQAGFQEGDYLEGGENGTTNLVDNTDSSYSLVTAGITATGSYSLHLAHPNAETNSFELDKYFIPSAASTLQFKTRLRYATSEQVVLVQVSRDEGLSWETLYTEQGSGGSGQGSFTSRFVSLADFDGDVIRVRFVYYFDGSGSYYSCTSTSCGLFVDDIEVVGAKELVDRTIVQVSGSEQFSFTRSALSPAVLAVRTIAWDGYPGLDWGPIFYLSEKAELSEAIMLLQSLAGASTDYSLRDVISILQILTGQ